MKPQAKGTITLAVGLPGAGKSTYFARRGITPLCSDTIRLWLLDDETDQSAQHLVFLTLRGLLHARLRLGRKQNYVDATNLTPRERRPYFQLAAQYGYNLHAIYFEVPLATCLERNEQRHRKVPKTAMERMARRLVPPSRSEGFTKIVVVKGK